jgi:outer membrane protein insertion porin family
VSIRSQLCALTLVAALLVPCGEAGAVEEGTRITALEVQGNEKVETEAILDITRLRAGERFRASEVAQAIRDIYRLRYFKHIAVESRPSEGGVVLVIRVQEKPAIRSVVIEGNKKVTTEDIKEVMNIKAFSILDEARLRSTSRRIEELYLEKGFFLAEVETLLTPIAGNEVKIAFKIRENRKVLVKRIDLVGNHNLKDGYIKGRLQTKTAGIFPGLGPGGTYRRETLETDREIISYLYSAFGYVDAKISAPEVFLSPDKRWVFITIHIDEGKQYRIGTIEVKGDLMPEVGLSAEDILESIQTRPGEVYNRMQLGEDVQRLVNSFSDHGYAFANVIPLPRQDRERQIIDLVFDVQRGNLIHLEDIIITGNSTTWDKVIRRQAGLVEGELFRGKEVQRTRARLQQLGYFEDINITTPRGDSPDSLNMAIDVTEKPTGTFSIGAGFSSVESFVFTANISKANFLGMGYTMSLSANLSLGRNLRERGFFRGENSQQQLSFNIQDPYFLDTRWTASIAMYSVQRTVLLSEFTRGMNFSLGHYIGKDDDARFSLRYSVETVGLTSLRATQKQAYGGQLYRSGTKSSITASLTLDKRDNRIAPTRGFLLTGSAEFAGGMRVNDKQVLSLLGGNFRFLRLQANVRGFYPIGTPLVVLRWNLSFGWIKSLDGTLVPYTERYRAGGINSVRGFTPFSLGPQIRYLVNSDPVHAADSVPVGGTMSLVNNLEIEFPIIPPAQIRGVVFLDAGNAFGGLYGDEPFRFETIRVSAGFGVRWRSPMGPLRFEWGFPLNRKPGERAQIFEFTIGSFF